MQRMSLCYRWIPTCADLFINQREKWLHLAPQNDFDSSQPIEEYFASVAILMSLQLREMVINSLQDLLTFFKLHEVHAAGLVDLSVPCDVDLLTKKGTHS